MFNFFRIILSILMSMYFGFENWVALKEFGYRSWTLSIGFIMDRDLFLCVIFLLGNWLGFDFCFERNGTISIHLNKRILFCRARRGRLIRSKGIVNFFFNEILNLFWIWTNLIFEKIVIGFRNDPTNYLKTMNKIMNRWFPSEISDENYVF